MDVDVDVEWTDKKMELKTDLRRKWTASLAILIQVQHIQQL